MIASPPRRWHERMSPGTISRRSAVRILGAGLLAAIFAPAALGQPASGTHRIGFLAFRSRSTKTSPDPLYDAFIREMQSLGYVEGKNLAVEWRFANGKAELLPALASELVRSNV